MIMKIFVVIVVLLFKTSQNGTLANKCVEFYENCCSYEMKGCNYFDCEYYQHHKDKEYKDDNLVAQYTDRVKYWFAHQEKDIPDAKYECMSPNHAKKKMEYDASPDPIILTNIQFYPNNKIYRSNGIKFKTNFSGIFDLSDLSKCNEIVEFKAKMIYLEKIHNFVDPGNGKYLRIEAPSTYYPKYDWALEFIEHKNSSPPWADDYCTKERSAWGRGSRYLFAIADTYLITDNGKSYYLTQENVFGFRSNLLTISSRSIIIYFRLETNEDLYVFVKLKTLGGKWTPEHVGAAYHYELEKPMKIYQADKTFYLDEPVNFNFNLGDLHIGRLGVEFDDYGVSYKFSKRYLNQKDGTAFPTTHSPTTTSEKPQDDQKSITTTSPTASSPTTTSEIPQDEKAKCCYCKFESVTCDCDLSKGASKDGRPCNCTVHVNKTECVKLKNKTALKLSSRAYHLMPSDWHKMASQYFCYMFAYVVMGIWY